MTVGEGEMAQQKMVLAAKSVGVSSIPESHRGRRKMDSQKSSFGVNLGSVAWSLHHPGYR